MYISVQELSADGRYPKGIGGLRRLTLQRIKSAAPSAWSD
jgi:hypothetical protein